MFFGVSSKSIFFDLAVYQFIEIELARIQFNINITIGYKRCRCNFLIKD